jgi:hypothetical protein
METPVAAGEFINPPMDSSTMGEPLVTGPDPASENTIPGYWVLTTVPVGKVSKFIVAAFALVATATKAVQKRRDCIVRTIWFFTFFLKKLD